MPAEATAVISDQPIPGASTSGHEPWAHEVATQQRTAKARHSAAAPETPQQTEERIYREWSEGVSSKKLTFDQQLFLAEEYVAKFSDTKTYGNKAQLESAREWLMAQNNRPSVEVDLQKNIQDHRPPTNNEIGLAIANNLGFTEDEIALFATEKGIPLSRAGEAFFQSTGPEANQALLKQAEKNPLGVVRIGEMHSGAIHETQKWLTDYRNNLCPNAIDSYDWAKQRTWGEAVATHLLVPTAGAAGSLTETVGDVVQGLGLPMHLIYSRTFMDSLGESLRQKGQSMDMTALYTPDEMNDAVIALVNVYAHAAGSAAPFLVPGAIATRFAAGAEALDALGVAADASSSTAATAQMPARALTLASEFMGGAANGGQVYDAAMTIQCRQLAEAELAGKPHSAKDVEDRIAAMKAGHLDAKKLEAIDHKSLIAAAFAAPIGVVQGRWLNEMSMELGRGVAPGELPESLILNVRNELTTGGLIGTTQLLSNEGSQVLAGVKTPNDAGQTIQNGLGDAALSGAMIGGTVGAGKGALNRRVETTEVEQNRPGTQPDRTNFYVPPLEIEDPSRTYQPEPVYLHDSPEVKGTASEQPHGSTEPLTVSPLSEPQLADSFANRFSKLTTEWNNDSELGRQYQYIDRLQRQKGQQEGKLSMALTDKLSPEEMTHFEEAPGDQASQDAIAKKAPELAPQYADFLKTAQNLDVVQGKVDAKIAARQEQVQSELDQFAQEAGIPKVRVEIVPDAQMGKAYASYLDGVMQLRESTITGQSSPAIAMQAVSHEMTHVEQDYLIARRFADEANVGVHATPEQTAAIKARYESANLPPPSDARINEALALRDGNALSESQRVRADALAKSLSEVRENGRLGHEVDRAENAVNSAVRTTQLNPRFELTSLEGSIASQSTTATMLFPNGVPSEIRQLIEDRNKPDFDADNARTILLAVLNERTAQLTAQRQQLHQTYMNFAHEQEARATAAAVRGNLPDSAHQSSQAGTARSIFDID